MFDAIKRITDDRNRIASEFHEFRTKAISELEALQKEVEGIRNNAPKCGACAEGLFCGSTMHQHDADCVYTERDFLRAQNRELREALNVAINTVECDSIGKDGNELPWYRMAKRALSQPEAGKV